MLLLIVESLKIHNIIIPQEEETEARFESRVHLFLDAHRRRTRHLNVSDVENWLTSLELCFIGPRRHTHHQFWRRRYGDDENLTIYTERWKMWEQPNIPASAQILSACTILLQRYKRGVGWDAFHAWLADMTPRDWTLPESFSLIEST